MSVNTKDSLDKMYQRSVADKVNKLIVPCAILQNKIPMDSKAKLGREYLEPVALTFEHGVTYGDGTAFDLLDPVAGIYDEAKVTSNPVVLRSQISQSAANRLANDEKAFLSWAGLRSEVMKESLAKRAEMELIYGGKGIGTVASTADVSASDVATITISEATWAAAIWGGAENAVLEVRRGASLIASPTVTAVDCETRTLSVSGTEAELDAIAQDDVLYFKGSYTNNMAGLDKIVTNTGSLFNISAASYQLWKGSSYAVTGALTFGKALKAVGKSVARAGLSGDVILLINPEVFEQLNSDYAAYRSSDSSYNSAKGSLGVKALEFHYQGGMIEIMPHPFVKIGDGFAFKIGSCKRIGATDVTFDTSVDGEGEFFLPLASKAGYELRCQYDYALFHNRPAEIVKLTGITIQA